MEKIVFKDEKHEKFYKEKEEALKTDEFLKPLIYLVGISDNTRKHWNEIYSEMVLVRGN